MLKADNGSIIADRTGRITCGEKINPEQLTRYWLGQGVRPYAAQAIATGALAQTESTIKVAQQLGLLTKPLLDK